MRLLILFLQQCKGSKNQDRRKNAPKKINLQEDFDEIETSLHFYMLNLFVKIFNVELVKTLIGRVFFFFFKFVVKPKWCTNFSPLLAIVNDFSHFPIALKALLSCF